MKLFMSGWRCLAASASASESGAEAAAAQSLREVQRRRRFAPASGLRRLQRRFLACLLTAFVVSSFAAETPKLTDVHGKHHDPLKAATYKATVILFTLPDCPIANAYAPEINRLVTDYSAKGVSFYLAHVDRDLTAAAARQHAKDYSLQCPVLLDSQHALVKALGATKTPQAFLLGPDGKPRYQGRINNLFADYGQRRQTVTQHDLRHALDAVLAGKPVSQPVTEVIGCHIQTTSENKQP